MHGLEIEVISYLIKDFNSDIGCSCGSTMLIPLIFISLKKMPVHNYGVVQHAAVSTSVTYFSNAMITPDV